MNKLLNPGDYVIVFSTMKEFLYGSTMTMGVFRKTTDFGFLIDQSVVSYRYAIPVKYFNENDIKETAKHILITVKNEIYQYEEPKLEIGEYVVADHILSNLYDGFGRVTKYWGVDDNHIKIGAKEYTDRVTFCIPLSKFNPLDRASMKEQCVKAENGILIREYKYYEAE